MKTILLSLLLCITATTYSQSVDTTTLANMPGMEVVRSRHLTGESLFTYMDRYADLFWEYGCKELFIRDYISPSKEKLTLELYVMKDAACAFGIYKLSISGCINVNTVSNLSCQTRHTTSAVHGSLFIAITHRSGTSDAMEMAGQIVRTLVKDNPAEQMVVPSVFQLPKVNKYLFNLRYFEGVMGIQKDMPQWVQMFEEVRFRMFAEKIESPDTLATLARIHFATNADLTLFLTNAGLNISDRSTEPVMTNDGFYRSWYKIDEYKILLLETKVPVSLYTYLPELVDIQKTVWDWEKGY